ncbi:MAG: hypothetical protein Q7T11_08320 [Deltaproteobacteria bacterium]|nr:hypothetical protein [Deltaproteobacteria bacterium]
MLFGALFSLFARQKSAVWHGLVFSSLFNAIVLYSYFKFPDWMWMYFIDAPRLGALDLIYIFLFLYYVPYLAGFYWGREFLQSGKTKVWLLILFLVAAEGWIVWKLFDRYSVIGTRQQFLDGTAISLFSPQNPISPVMNGGLALMAVYFLVVWWRHRKYSY